jgi:Putative DNA-binding domain
MALAEEFDALDLNGIRQYVQTQQEEDVYLEFKTARTTDLSHADDRKNLAKALSGFGNSSGGLLVWGIEAGKNADQIDCATRTAEIAQVRLFVTRLNALTGQAVSPIVEGVCHKTIVSGGDAGFAVTLVPESDSGPHMAKCREDRYYKRRGDSFYRMEHYDVEDMFGRRRKPRLELTTRLEGRGANTEIIIGIKNVGRGTARAPYLAFNATAPFQTAPYGLDGNGNNGLPKLHYGQSLKYRYGSTSGIVIHPDTIHEVTRVRLPGYNPRPEMLPNVDIVIDYEI